MHLLIRGATLSHEKSIPKIFLWFWMTLLIIGVTLIAGLVMNHANQNMRRQTLTRMSLYLPLEAKQAADIFEKDGTDRLQEHLAHLRVVAELEPYFITPDGKDALGRPFPRKLFRSLKVRVKHLRSSASVGFRM